jgi:Holliday junction resolvase RusA-like endonuclease
MPIAKSLSQREHDRRLINGWAHDCKKDVDNMQKLYQDILNFGPLKNKIFIDDHQICDCKTSKVWSRSPGIFIHLHEIKTQYCGDM